MAKKGLRSWVKENWVDIAKESPMVLFQNVEENLQVEKKKKISKMRAHCKSKSDEQRAKASAVEEKS